MQVGRGDSAEGDAMAPRPHWQPGFYERRFRGPLLYVGVLLGVLPALLLGLPIALINAVAHRGFRRAFFVQERVGWRGRIFVILKFRTMVGDSDGGSDQLRVTRFGRFLRNAHLDELPQVWNLLRGDMSLIGPRPEMLPIHKWAAAAVPGFGRRLDLRPGLTGLAQITQGYTAAGDIDAYVIKAELDAAYAQRISPRMDAGILLRTVVWVLRARGWLKRPKLCGLPRADAANERRLAA